MAGVKRCTQVRIEGKKKKDTSKTKKRNECGSDSGDLKGVVTSIAFEIMLQLHLSVCSISECTNKHFSKTKDVSLGAVPHHDQEGAV